MKMNNEMSGGEKFAAAINDLWRFVGVALSWLWEHGGPFIISVAKAISAFAVSIWQMVFNRNGESKESTGAAIHSTAASTMSGSTVSSSTVGSSTMSSSTVGSSTVGSSTMSSSASTKTVGAKTDATTSFASNSNSSSPSFSGQMREKVGPAITKTRETAGPMLRRAWDGTVTTTENAWTAAKPKMASFGESVKSGATSAKGIFEEASAEGGSLNSAYTKAQGWLKGGLPSIIGAELLVLLAGALVFWLLGRMALFSYTWLIMIIGVLIAIAAMVKGYFDMNLERVEGFFTPNRDGGKQEYAVAATDSQIRYTAFAQMAFWSLIGIVAIIFGATVFSIAF